MAGEGRAASPRGWSPTCLVEPSMSVNRKVTVPVGLPADGLFNRPASSCYSDDIVLYPNRAPRVRLYAILRSRDQ